MSKKTGLTFEFADKLVDTRKSAKKVIFPKEIFLGPTNPYDISIFVLWAFISLFLKSAPQNLMNLKGDPKFIPVSMATEGNKRSLGAGRLRKPIVQF